MNEPIALTKSGESEAVAFACGKCGTIAGSTLMNGSAERAFKAAVDHCACIDCGGERDRQFMSTCKACGEKKRAEQNAEAEAREAARFAKALKVPFGEYGGVVYDPSEKLGREGFVDIDDIEDQLETFEPDERPAYVWSCSERRPAIDPKDAVERMIEQACSDHHDEAYEQTVGDAELLAAIAPAIEVWNAAQTTRTFEVDYSVAIVLPTVDDEETAA